MHTSTPRYSRSRFLRLFSSGPRTADATRIPPPDTTMANTNTSLQTTSPQKNTPSPPVTACFQTAELFELILATLDFPSLHQALNVCHDWRITIAHSSRLLKLLYLNPQLDATVTLTGYITTLSQSRAHIRTLLSPPRKLVTMNPFLWQPPSPSLQGAHLNLFRPAKFTRLLSLPADSSWSKMYITQPPCTEIAVAYEAWFSIPETNTTGLQKFVEKSCGKLDPDFFDWRGFSDESMLRVRCAKGVTVGMLVERVKGSLMEGGEGLERLATCLVHVRLEDGVVEVQGEQKRSGGLSVITGGLAKLDDTAMEESGSGAMSEASNVLWAPVEM